MVKDRELITRIRQGEKELFEELAGRYYQDVYHFCFYKTGDEELAYDCTQETFLHVIRFFDSYVDQNHFRAWILSIARNVCSDYFRSKKLLTVDETFLENEQAQEAGYSQAEIKDSVMAALNRLPEIQKEVVILKFYYDMKVREIASVVGVKVPTVKSRLKQGMDRLKKILSEEGGFAE